MLDALDKRINIKDLSIEDPVRSDQLFFDPERDVTEQDWKNMSEHLDALRQESSWPSFANMATSMKLLSEKEFSKIPLLESDWEALTERAYRVEEDWNQGVIEDVGDYTGIASNMKILFPNKFPDFDLNLGILHAADNSIHDQSYELSVDPTNEDALLSMSASYLDLSIVEPGSFKMNFSAGAPGDTIAKALNLMTYFDLIALAQLRATDFQRFKDYSLSPDQWKNEINLLKRYRNSRNDPDTAESFAYQARCLKIMAAQDIKITDSGINIILSTPKADFNKPPTMPQRRSF